MGLLWATSLSVVRSVVDFAQPPLDLGATELASAALLQQADVERAAYAACTARLSSSCNATLVRRSIILSLL